MSARRARHTCPRLPRLLLGFALAACVAVGVAQSTAARPAAASTATDGAELDFFNRTNQARAENGLPALAFDPAAAAVAREWSAQMDAADSLTHNPNLAAQIGSRVTSQWTRIGENIGVGDTVAGLQSAFMNSSGHRANVLGDFNRVGIGVVYGTHNGRPVIWVTLDFVKGPAISSTPPAPPTNSPVGRLDSLTANASGLTVQGWTLDLDTTAALEVHVLVDGALAGWSYASQYRPDVGQAFPGLGDFHGFSFTSGAAPGVHTVCVYGINVAGGANTLLGCQSVAVPANPIGRLDGIWIGVGRAVVGGWAIDPQTSNPIEIHVLVDGAFAGWDYASKSRPDVGAAYAGYGSAHGFDFAFPIDGGRHTVCVYGINVGIGINTLLGCQVFDVQASPIGQLDGLVPVDGALAVDGWGLDPQTTSPIEIHVLVDGQFVGWGYAAYNRPDIASTFPAYGGAHGFAFRTARLPGTHQVCIYGINVGAGINTLLGCRTISM